MSNLDQTTVPAAAHAARIPLAAYALCLCIGIVGANSLALGPIAPRVAESFAVSVPAVMSASAVFGIGTAASALFLAGAIDRFGAGRSLRGALLLLAVALAGCAAAPGLAIFVGAQFVAGIAAGLALPSIYTLAAVAAPPGRESDTLGVVLFGWTLSMVAGVSLSAILADAAGWRVVYATVFVATLLSFAAVTGPMVLAPRRSTTAQSPLSALHVPGIAPLLVACAAFMISFYGVYAYIGDHLHRRLGLPLGANGLLALSYGLGFGATAFLNRLIDRFGAGRLLPGLFLTVAAIYLAMVAASSTRYGLFGIAFAWGLANHAALNALIVRLGSLDPTRRGAIMGLNSGVTYLSLFVGTAAFGPLYDYAGLAALAGTAAALMLAAMLAAALARCAPAAPKP